LFRFCYRIFQQYIHRKKRLKFWLVKQFLENEKDYFNNNYFIDFFNTYG
jgi:hypothetical protein